MDQRERTLSGREEKNRIRMKRRAKVVRRQKCLLFTVLFLLVLIIGLFSLRAFAYADESLETGRVKQYKSITIYAGDSLYQLSTTYMTPEYADPMTYVREVAFINHMDPDDPLIPGNHLIIPYYTAEETH
ncbi:MAG: hypothetical protein IKS87_01780 [Lachnospiraceae bacterium]|nr:hypothetical protein [Lachnospiraceae bacterium]